MRRSLDQYLQDILTALAELDQFMSGVPFKSYLGNTLLRRAAEREFSIIGEAVAQMTQHFPEARERIEDIGKIKSFRNFIIHEYSHVDDSVVWDVATHDAPVLRAEVERWKEELDQQP
jgi:uncharacterized protein with HEPN domain